MPLLRNWLNPSGCTLNLPLCLWSSFKLLLINPKTLMMIWEIPKFCLHFAAAVVKRRRVCPLTRPLRFYGGGFLYCLCRYLSNKLNSNLSLNWSIKFWGLVSLQTNSMYFQIFFFFDNYVFWILCYEPWVCTITKLIIMYFFCQCNDTSSF